MRRPNPLRADDARRQIRRILTAGTVRFSGHAKKRMAERRVHAGEVLGVLKGGVVSTPEFDAGTWRYTVRLSGIGVVVAFDSEMALALVTVWRESR